jgi:hypothetical protein
MLMGSSDVTDEDDWLRFTNEARSAADHPAGALAIPHPPSVTDGLNAGILGPVGNDPVLAPPVRLNRLQRHNLVRRFNAEARHRRRLYRKELQREWESEYAPAFDQENDRPNEEEMMDEEIAFESFMCQRLNYFDEDVVLKKENFLNDICCASLPSRLFPNGITAERPTDKGPDAYLLRRTQELWAGLRRVYFGEVEDPSDSEEELKDGVWRQKSNSDGPSRKKPRTREAVMDFKQEIEELRTRIRNQPVPDDLHLPVPPPLHRDSDDQDGPSTSHTIPVLGLSLVSDGQVFDPSLPRDVSKGRLKKTIPLEMGSK